MVCVSMLIGSLCASAQNESLPVNEPDYNKPLLFASLPTIIPVTTDGLHALVQSTMGANVDMEFGALQFRGRVLSTDASVQNDLLSVVVRSTNYPGAVFTLSRTLIGNKTFFTGRILSMQHGDLFELKYNEGHYELVKRNFYDLVNE